MNLLFTVDILPQDTESFAELSGDWNPLHTDKEYAATTTFKKPILHGAYAAGLVSRVAGMYLPGKSCLLHRMNLRFVAPITPPVTLNVFAKERSAGWVDVEIGDKKTGKLYVKASFGYGLHHTDSDELTVVGSTPVINKTEEKVLIVGATGGIGSALMRELGDEALGISRAYKKNFILVEDIEEIEHVVKDVRIKGVVNCGWPVPDNEPLISNNSLETRVEHSVSKPLREMLSLANLLNKRGVDNAFLMLIGSTFSEPGSHNYRMPLYTLSKSLVPTLTKILALELAGNNKRCFSVVFDVINTGMNRNMSELMKIKHADRSPSGILPSATDVAKQIIWVMDNNSHLLSGATINLSGGNLP